MKEKINIVKEVLESPDEIRQSKTDKEVFLYYKRFDKLYCVVVRHEKREGFIITAYPADKIKEGDMEKIVVYYHKDSDTMDVWFGNPEDEVICEEVGEGIILKKDKNGKTIGIEKLYVSKTLGINKPLPLEIVVA